MKLVAAIMMVICVVLLVAQAAHSPVGVFPLVLACAIAVVLLLLLRAAA